MTGFEDFLKPTLSGRTLDVFGPRSGILKAIERELPNFHGTLLDVGCGRMPYRQLLQTSPSRTERYIGLDLGRDAYGKPHVAWDGRLIPIGNGRIDCAMATEVLEHCPDPSVILLEIARVLKPGGMFFFTVPFLWPLHDSPYDEYRYTPFAVERLLKEAGFVTITLKATGGWDASLAQMIGLWARRRPMTARMRRLVTFAAEPLVRALFRKDDRPQVWKDQVMITGLSGTAFKPNDARHG